MPRRLLAVCSLFALGLVQGACDKPRAPVVEPVDRGPSPDPATDPLGARLFSAVAAHAGRMDEVGTVTRGTMTHGASAEQGLLMFGAHCYAIFVEAVPEAGELRLRVIDSNGDPVQVDRDRGPSATLGVAEPLCPERPGEYRLEIASANGGAYAMRVFNAPAL